MLRRSPMLKKPGKCPHCRERLERIGQKLHDHCAGPWAEAFAQRQAAKRAAEQRKKEKIARAVDREAV